MAKFTVEVKETIRYSMEVEADSFDAARLAAEDIFFADRIEDRCKKWEYDGGVDFEWPKLVDNDTMSDAEWEEVSRLV